MFALCKKILSLTGAFLLCLSLFACAKDTPATTTKENGAENTPTKENSLSSGTQQTPQEEEILSKMGTWLGRGDSGNLNDPDSFDTKEIKTKKDLEPYLEYMYDLSEEDINKILGDKEGKCLMIEFTGVTDHTLYATSSIVRAGGTISVNVSTQEIDETLPSHTYFLLYFPEEVYNGEAIEVVFLLN